MLDHDGAKKHSQDFKRFLRRGIIGLQYSHPLRLMAMKQALLFFAIAILLLSTAASQNSAQSAPDVNEGKKIFAAAGCRQMP